MLVLLYVLLPIVIIAFIIGAVLKNKGKGDESVFRHLYIYLVLFATLMMTIGGGISIFMAAADLVSPPAFYQSYNEFVDLKNNEADKKESGLSEEELRRQYETAVNDHKDRVKNEAKNQLIKSLGFIIIPLPIFLYFNKLRGKGESL